MCKSLNCPKPRGPLSTARNLEKPLTLTLLLVTHNLIYSAQPANGAAVASLELV